MTLEGDLVAMHMFVVMSDVNIGGCTIQHLVVGSWRRVIVQFFRL